jgi:hypothetical protein
MRVFDYSIGVVQWYQDDEDHDLVASSSLLASSSPLATGTIQLPLQNDAPLTKQYKLISVCNV